MALKQNLAHLNLKSVKLLWKQGCCNIVTNNQRLSDKKLELIKITGDALYYRFVDQWNLQLSRYQKAGPACLFLNVSIASVLFYLTFQRSKIQPMPVEFLYLTVLLVGSCIVTAVYLDTHQEVDRSLSMSKSAQLSEVS